MAFKKKSPTASTTFVPESELVKPVVESDEVFEPDEMKQEPGYECIRVCYFNLRLWQEGEQTPYIAGIENCRHFKEVK